MKKICILIIIVLIIIIIFIVWKCWFKSPERQAVPPQTDLPKTYFVFKVKAPDIAVPDTLIVYETLLPKVNKDTVEKFCEIFNVKGEIVDKKNLYSVMEKDKEIEIFKEIGTGLFKYCDYSKSYLEEDVPNLPSPEEAISLSKNFLAKNELLGSGNELYAGCGYFEFAKFDNSGKKLKEGKSSITVGFKYKIEEYPVEGSGAKTSITFGRNGEIIEYMRMWRDIKPYKEMETIDINTALIEFKGKWGPEASERQMKEADILTTVTIEKVYLAYLTRTGSKPQRYVKPVYIFKGYFQAKGEHKGKEIKSSEAFLFTIKAIKDVI